LIKAVLFDLYETLGRVDIHDEEQLGENRLRDIIDLTSSRKMNVDAARFRQVFHDISSEASRRSQQESVEIPIDKIFARVLKELNLPADDRLLIEMEKVYYRIPKNRWILFNDTRETLQKLSARNFKLALVSNVRSDRFVRELVKEVNIERYFDVIITSAQLGIRKPRPQLFLEALKELKVRPDQAAIVGDTLTTDIQGGAALGMKTILINRNRTEVSAPKPDATIGNLSELLGVLEKWNGSWHR